MTDRILLVLAGLAGLASVWLLDYQDRRQYGRKGRSFWDCLLRAWVSGNPVGGAMGIGWLLAASVGLIAVGLVSFES